MSGLSVSNSANNFPAPSYLLTNKLPHPLYPQEKITQPSHQPTQQNPTYEALIHLLNLRNSSRPDGPLQRGDGPGETNFFFPATSSKGTGRSCWSLHGQHKAVATVPQQLSAARTQPRWQRTRSVAEGVPPALQMTKNGQARFLARQALQLLGEMNRMADVFLMEFFQFGRGLFPFLLCLWPLFFGARVP